METLEQVLKQVGYAQSYYQFVMVKSTDGKIDSDSPAIICHSGCLDLYPDYCLFVGSCDELFTRLYRAENRGLQREEITKIITEAEIRFILKSET